jgi:hypothetical protein
LQTGPLRIIGYLARVLYKNNVEEITACVSEIKGSIPQVDETIECRIILYSQKEERHLGELIDFMKRLDANIATPLIPVQLLRFLTQAIILVFQNK